MSRFLGLSLGVFLAGGITAAGLEAQSAQKWSIQISGIGVGGGGDAFAGVSTGWGGEVQVRYTPGSFSLGLGFQYSSHDYEDEDPSIGAVPVKYYGPFAEPRYVIDLHSSTLAPYLSARLAWLSQSADFQNFDVTAKGSGFQVNGGGGVLVRLSDRINLDLGATFGTIHFGDYIAKQGGEELFRVEGGNGTNLIGRIGVAIGIK